MYIWWFLVSLQSAILVKQNYSYSTLLNNCSTAYSTQNKISKLYLACLQHTDMVFIMLSLKMHRVLKINILQAKSATWTLSEDARECRLSLSQARHNHRLEAHHRQFNPDDSFDRSVVSENARFYHRDTGGISLSRQTRIMVSCGLVIFTRWFSRICWYCLLLQW